MQTGMTDDVDDFFASLEAELSSSPSSVAAVTEDDDATNSEETEIIRNKQSITTSVAEAVEKPNSSSSSSNLNAAELAKLTIPKLKDLLRERGLKVSGKKAELIDRLT